jgi:hypothetical protein
MFLFGLIVGLLGGGLTVGVVANRKPEWFSKAVVAANKVDDLINAAVAKATGKSS